MPGPAARLEKDTAMAAEKSAMSPGKIAVSMMSMCFFTFGIQYIAMNFVPIYIAGLSFSTGMTVGIMMAVGSLVSAAAQPCWGMLADRSKTKNRVLAVVLLGVASAIWLLIIPDHKSLLTLVPCFAVTYCFLLVPTVLNDTIIVEKHTLTGLRYGFIRSFSSFGAAFTALAIYIFSLFAEISPKTALVMVSALALVSLVPLSFMPKTKGHGYGKAPGGRASPRGILKNRRLVLLLAFGFCQFMLVSCSNTFFSVYYGTDQGLNAGVGLFSLFYTVCIMAEAVVMITCAGLMSKVSVYFAFLLAPLAGGGRCLIMYLVSDKYLMFLAAVFHALMFGPLMLRLAPYIQATVPEEMRATSQAVWSLTASGMGAIAGSLIGGVIVRLVGIRNLFAIVAAASFAVFLVFCFLFGRQRRRDAAEGFVSG